MKTIKLIISGVVQRVGYRRWFEQKARQLDLKGYVKNLENGTVEAVISGSEQNLLTMIQQSYIGPLRSRVEHVEQTVLDGAEGFTEFKMIR
ncbi:acylphosphatase [Acinetobacter sp. WZC-1]|uniref:acylphosphatase n=1 Tax=Acinetobacter sp. WZC-1 TaxID=3459034 RepID=UPI00403D84DE